MSVISRARIVLLLLAAGPPLPEAAENVEEYEIKAVYLYNIANYITWPEGSFQDAGASFNLCVLGQNPFGGLLDFIASQRKVHERTVSVFFFEEIKEAESCHLLFVSASLRRQVPSIISRQEKHAVLLISEAEGFAAAGGMIEFFMKDNKVRLLINPHAVNNAKLKASTHLIRVSKLVE